MTSIFDHVDEDSQADPRFTDQVPRPILTATRRSPPARKEIYPLSGKKELSFFFLNVQGLGTSIEKCAAMAKANDFLAFSETNKRPHQISEAIKSDLGSSCIVSGTQDDIEAKTGCPRKTSGYGIMLTGLRFPPKTRLIFNSSKFEIMAVELRLGDLRGIWGTMYRSPSMREPEQVREFYDTLLQLLQLRYAVDDDGGYDFLIVGGDDNSSPKPSAHYTSNMAYKELVKITEKCECSLPITSNTRLNNQPDHLILYFDSSVCNFVVEEPLPGIHPGDHKALRARLQMLNFVQQKPKFMQRKVRIGSPDWEKIKPVLDKKLRKYYYEFSNFVKKTYTIPNFHEFYPIRGEAK